MPGATGELLLDWARRADEASFSSLGVLDRVAYDSYEPFAALAGAAGVTSRIRLATMIAIGPLRRSGCSRSRRLGHGLSGGRLTLGLAVGARTEDFEAAGVEHKGRGKRLGEQLAYIRGGVDGDRVGPSREGIEILVGGLSGRRSRGWRATPTATPTTAGRRAPSRGAAARAEAAWRDFGREGRPRLWGQGYFTFKEPDRGNDYLLDYYAFVGPFAEKIAAGNLTSARAVKDFVRGYEEAGCDELVLFPTLADADELERLQEALA